MQMPCDRPHTVSVGGARPGPGLSGRMVERFEHASSATSIRATTIACRDRAAPPAGGRIDRLPCGRGAARVLRAKLLGKRRRRRAVRRVARDERSREGRSRAGAGGSDGRAKGARARYRLRRRCADRAPGGPTAAMGARRRRDRRAGRRACPRTLPEGADHDLRRRGAPVRASRVRTRGPLARARACRRPGERPARSGAGLAAAGRRSAA